VNPSGGGYGVSIGCEVTYNRKSWIWPRYLL
jgi:hypothetical protein